MDRKIEQKRWNSKRILTVGGITALVLLIASSIYFTSGKSKLDVDTERITVSEITKGPFQVTIPVNGLVMPITTIYLDAINKTSAVIPPIVKTRLLFHLFCSIFLSTILKMTIHINPVYKTTCQAASNCKSNL